LISVKLRSRLRVVGVTKDIERKLAAPLLASGALVQTEARTALGVQGPSASPGDSMAYYNKDLGAWVKASTPPNPPHRQTGKLRSSVQTGMLSKNEVIISANAPYAKYYEAEYGSVASRSRPFMRPSLVKSISRIVRSFYKFVGI